MGASGPPARLNNITESLDINLREHPAGSALYPVHGVTAVWVYLNISSVNAIRGNAGVAIYSATKAALDGLTRALARELVPSNIRVNSLAPGYFESDMVGGLTKRQIDKLVRSTPLRRLGTIEEIAEAALFLMSPAAAFITGHTLVVDGGVTC